jgi:hypothetical protein
MDLATTMGDPSFESSKSSVECFVEIDKAIVGKFRKLTFFDNASFIEQEHIVYGYSSLQPPHHPLPTFDPKPWRFAHQSTC